MDLIKFKQIGKIGFPVKPSPTPVFIVYYNLLQRNNDITEEGAIFFLFLLQFISFYILTKY